MNCDRLTIGAVCVDLNDIRDRMASGEVCRLTETTDGWRLETRDRHGNQTCHALIDFNHADQRQLIERRLQMTRTVDGWTSCPDFIFTAGC